MGTTVVVPGSFDPVTYGHLDIIERASTHFDRVVVAVMDNSAKSSLFSVQERQQLIRESVPHLGNVEIDSFLGLLVEFCHKRGIGVIAKGLRAVSDFEYELQMAQMNKRMGDVETVFMPTSPEHSYLSSSLVKQVAKYHGPLDGTVPSHVAKALSRKFA